jgi:hypothetical protein
VTRAQLGIHHPRAAVHARLAVCPGHAPILCHIRWHGYPVGHTVWNNAGMTSPSQQLTRAAKAYRNAETSLALARASLRTAILADLANGVTQAELGRETGYSREQLRRIARDAGLPRAQP